MLAAVISTHSFAPLLVTPAYAAGHHDVLRHTAGKQTHALLDNKVQLSRTVNNIGV
jgi:hypothetical protein